MLRTDQAPALPPGAMRILFFAAGRSNERLALAMARALKERIPGARFAAVTTREHNLASSGRVLRDQGERVFDEIVSHASLYNEGHRRPVPVEPDELERLEALYGAPRLSALVTADRLLSKRRSATLYRDGAAFGRERIHAILAHTLQGVEALFDRFAPDAVVFAGTDTSAGIALVLNQVAHARGVPVRVPHLSRVGAHYLLTDTVFSRFEAVRETYEHLSALDAPEGSTPEGSTPEGSTSERTTSVGGTRGGHVMPGSGRRPHRAEAEALVAAVRRGGARYPSAVAPRRTLAERLALYRRASVDAVSGRYRGDAMEPSFVARARDAVVRRARQVRLRAHNPFRPARLDRRYALFPLHVEPELALQLYAPYHTDQIGVIRNVAQALPVGTLLYVKEHPYTFNAGLRAPGYYEALRRIPGVELVTGDMHTLIEHCEALVTITGTAGLEAMLLGKPVLTLGEVFYNDARPAVEPVASYDDLPAAYDRAVRSTADPGCAARYVEAMLHHTIEVPPGTVLDRTADGPPDEAQLERYLDFVLQSLRLGTTAGTNPAARVVSSESGDGRPRPEGEPDLHAPSWPREQ